MTFIKKHYEKVVLSVVLLGLVVAAAALPLQVSRVRTLIDETVVNLSSRTKPKEFKPFDEYLKTNEVVLKRFEGAVEFNLSTPHNLFNPVIWKKRGTRLEKIASSTEIGPGALVVTNITPLRLTVEFDRAEAVAAGDSNYRYHFVVTRDTDSSPKKLQSATLALPNNALFILTKLEGPPNDPTAFHLQLKGEKQPVVVGKDKPYVRVVGYSADLKYPRDTRPYLKKRVREVLTLRDDPEKYKIVSITSNEVVLSAESTEKRTTISMNTQPD